PRTPSRPSLARPDPSCKPRANPSGIQPADAIRIVLPLPMFWAALMKEPSCQRQPARLAQPSRRQEFLGALDDRSRRRVETCDQLLPLLTRRRREVRLNFARVGAKFRILHRRIERAPQQRGLLGSKSGRRRERPPHG